MIMSTIMVNKSANQMQRRGYRLNVEDSKYLIFKSNDHFQKINDLEIIVHNLIDIFLYSKNNKEKQDEILSHMSAIETFVKSLTYIKIELCDDDFDFLNQDVGDFVDPFGLQFSYLDYFFITLYKEENLIYQRFLNTLKSDELKDTYID